MKDTTCEACSRSFKSASGLTNHRRTAHGAAAGKGGASAKGRLTADKLAERLRAVESELEDWRSGRIVLPFDPELHASNEESAARLEAYVRERVDGLGEIEVKALARKYKLWPPPDPGARLRSYVPTGGL